VDNSFALLLQIRLYIRRYDYNMIIDHPLIFMFLRRYYYSVGWKVLMYCICSDNVFTQYRPV